MIVLDSSAALDYLLGTPHGSFVSERLERQGIALAPHLLDCEVLAFLRRAVARGEVTESRAILALGHFGALRIMRFPHLRFAARVWELRHSITATDAFFVALAEETGAPLVTTDLRLARSHGHRAVILAP